MSNHTCIICNYKLKSNTKLAYYSDYEHFIKNYYLKKKSNTFSGIMMKNNNWYFCIKCSIDYYNWQKLCSRDKLNRLFIRRINGNNYKLKINKINKNIFSEFESCSNCEIILNVKKNQNVNSRFNYVEGIGSFCEPCYNIIS